MERIRIVQIGVEHDHAAMTFDSLKRQSDIFELVGYCDPEEEEGVYIGKDGARYRDGYLLKEGETIVSQEYYADYPRLSLEEVWQIPGLQAVTVETSEKNLTYYAQLAADHGLHVHMDKPGGYDYPAYERLIDTFRKNGKVFHAGYMYRYNPEVKKLLTEIEEGKYGEIYSVECHMDCRHAESKREWMKNYQGGMMYFLGCHLIDLIYRIQGEPEEVLALNHCTGLGGIEGEDLGFAVLKYKNGVSFAKTCDTEAGGFLRRQLVVCGEKGSAVLEPLEAFVPGMDGTYLTTGVRKVTEDIYNWGNDGVQTVSEIYQRYDPMMAGFASFVHGEAENPYSLDYELRMYRVMLKACGIDC